MIMIYLTADQESAWFTTGRQQSVQMPTGRAAKAKTDVFLSEMTVSCQWLPHF
jgi:hypothetical protein